MGKMYTMQVGTNFHGNCSVAPPHFCYMLFYFGDIFSSHFAELKNFALNLGAKAKNCSLHPDKHCQNRICFYLNHRV